MNFFTLGSKFSSFEALKAALIQYKKETHVEFFIRDCKTLEQAAIKRLKCAANANADLIYHRLKLFCVRGGRPFISSSTGQRNRTSLRLGCQAYIYLSLSRCKQYLEVKDYDFEHNHEIVPRPLYRKDIRAERRRQRLMDSLNISYAEVLQMEKGKKIKKDEDFTLAKNHGVNKSEEEEEDVSNNQEPEIDDSVTLLSEDCPEQIYTRTGDDGTTSTFNGERLHKDDKIFEAVGTVEELSSTIGFAIEFFPESCEDICEELREIQCILQDLAIHVGTPRSYSTTFHRINSNFPKDHLIKIENHIAKYTERLPKLDDIILPSGGKGSSALHVARSVCRRAERRITCLVQQGEVNPSTIQYLNRLGDYLFAVARVVCICDEGKESMYRKPKIYKPARKLYREPVPKIVENEPYRGCEIIYLSQPET